MFEDNKYSRWYYSIINAARARAKIGYTETHHIIPRSMGGNDTLDNLVELTAREHIICHMLLIKMTSGEHRAKLLYAYIRMSGRQIYNNRKYAYFREEYARINGQLRSGAGNGMYGVDRKGNKNTFFGRRHSEETKLLISTKKRGQSCNKGISRSLEHKKKISMSRRANAKRFSFSHSVHGVYYGSILELHETYLDLKLRKDELWKLTVGRYKSYKGWSVTITFGSVI